MIRTRRFGKSEYAQLSFSKSGWLAHEDESPYGDVELDGVAEGLNRKSDKFAHLLKMPMGRLWVMVY